MNIYDEYGQMAIIIKMSLTNYEILKQILKLYELEFNLNEHEKELYKNLQNQFKRQYKEFHKDKKKC